MSHSSAEDAAMQDPGLLDFHEQADREDAVDRWADGEGVVGGFARAATPRRRVLALLALAASAAAAAGWQTTLGYLARDDDLPVPSGDRRLPHRLRGSIPRLDPALPDEAISAIVRKLRFRDDMHFSDLLHWLRVFSERPDDPGAGASVPAVLDEITRAGRLERRFGGRSCLVWTRDGARYRFAPRSSPEAGPGLGLHAYQALATFAEIGVGLGQALTLPAGEEVTVAAILRDLMANFQARSVADIEPEWAAVALLLYVPPQRSWRNRWGERVGLQEVADYVARAPRAGAACGGIHSLFALSVARQVDRAHAFLSRGTSARIAELLGAATSALASTQADDGSWSEGWESSPARRRAETWDAVHVTGHLLEWQSLLPPAEQAPRACLERALRFLARVTLEASDEEVAQLYCPFSHAARVVLEASV
jgi:hypothetical protein